MRLPVVLLGGLLVLALGAGAWFLLAPAPETRPGPGGSAGPVPAAAPAASPVTRPAPEPANPRRSAPAPTPAPAPVAAPAVVPEAAPTVGTLHIESDVPDASVFLDRVGVGTTPLTIPNVSPGSHRLNVSATGYDGFVETIEVEPGNRTITVRFKEVRLAARLDAVHKHGIGSCRGELSASPEGLRYEAVDGKDSMSIPFADITAFEADYLAKNLRVKTRQGKTLNFTERDGDADRLVVFHEAVEKVRKRLTR